MASALPRILVDASTVACRPVVRSPPEDQMKFRIFTIALASLLWLPLAAGAQHAPDAWLTDRVVGSVTSYTRFTIFDDIDVLVENGAVTLRGKVTMPFKRDDIVRRVEAIEGVRSVRNEIEVLPVSIQDDVLRRKIARAIYGNSAFWQLAALPHPPIHIIVERGRVTLTGVVPSEVDRALARSLATGHGEFSVVSALRTDAEMRAARFQTTISRIR
jgi:hyperosmotically inducible protein